MEISVILFILLLNMRLIRCIIMDTEEHYHNQTEYSFSNALQACVRFEDYNRQDVIQAGGRFMQCVGKRVNSGLIENFDKDFLDIGDGVTFIKDPKLDVVNRENYFTGIDEEPSFKGIINGYSTFLSQRALRWDLSHFYPGLVMKIGPTMNGQGILEFAVEKRLGYNDRANLRPGQLVIRQTILPHLLGLRLNLITLIPIVFAIIVYVTKNAVIFSKISLVVSTFLALKSLFLMHHMNQSQNHFPHDPIDAGGGIISLRPQGHSLLSDQKLLQAISANLPPFKGVNDKYIEDRDKRSGSRNFVWEKQST